MINPAPNTRKIELNWPIRNQKDLPELQDIGTIHFLEIWLSPKVVFNSSGIRDWLGWLKPFASQKSVTIQFYQCPETFIQLANMISDFLPSNSEVISFYVPFYSEHTSETKKVLLTRGHEFFDEKIALPEIYDKDGNMMELDIDVHKFFKFLKAK
jgi:hypothetical protein